MFKAYTWYVDDAGELFWVRRVEDQEHGTLVTGSTFFKPGKAGEYFKECLEITREEAELLRAEREEVPDV